MARKQIHIYNVAIFLENTVSILSLLLVYFLNLFLKTL